MSKLAIPILMWAFALTGCHQPTAAEKAAGAFTVDNLQPGDGADLTGCITRVGRAGVTGARIFIEDSLQGGANGYIRLNGQLTRVTMVTGGADAVHSIRSFVDTTKALSVVESYNIGEAAAGTTVRPVTGELIVTWKGGTQRIPIGGARNCIDAP
ncbi:hypothetical protein MMA231_01094 [Asticcacaulis sp. MM231]|uniref:hypothetical protein n=1 Tax=Asticcacaulis sp. MM231 TaxID=3157666 RepID=UPI0032D58DA5